MSCVKSCVGGVHVFIMAYLAIGMSNCLSDGHVLDLCFVLIFCLVLVPNFHLYFPFVVSISFKVSYY